MPGAAPPSSVVVSSPTARSLDQRVFNRHVQRRTGLQALMVRQNLSRIIARPVSVFCRAPLPVEGQVIVRRLGSVGDVRRSAAGNV
jgi:hypothetical protein